MDGKNRDGKLNALLALMETYYKEYKPPSTIQNLTMDMVKQDKKYPKLRAKGAETRHLVPFGYILAQNLYDTHQTTQNMTLKNLMFNLLGFYSCMAQEPFQHEVAGARCRKTLLLYKALSDEAAATNQTLWKCKPKMHMWQELAEHMTEHVGNPQDFWCYKDEDFVGFISELAHSRGGGSIASMVPTTVLDRCRAPSQQAL